MICSLTSCGKKAVVTSQQDKIDISFSWWGNDARNEYTIEAIRQFEQLNPDIKVTCKYSEWSGYQLRSNVQMVSRTEADVMQINYAWIAQYSPDGTGYYDLNNLSHKIDLSNFTENELSYGMQNGKLNALPIALNTQTVYINKTLYDKYGLSVPKTWDDIFEVGKVMNGEHYPMSANNKAIFFYMIAYAEQQSDNIFIEEDGTAGFTDDDYKLMLDFYSRLVNEKVIPQIEYFERLNLENEQYAGTVAWLSDAYSYMGGVAEAGYEVEIVDYTMSKNSDELNWYVKPATMYAISANTEYPEESARLMDFLLNSAEMAELQGVEKGIPISKSARSYLEKTGQLTGLQYEAFLKMSEYSDKLTLISPYMENTDIIETIQESCNAVLYEKATSEDEATKLRKAVEKLLES